jgi:CheY-like chemotaxis protein
MDSEMPVMDGTTAMRYIREEHGGKAPYMAVVTASGVFGCTCNVDNEMTNIRQQCLAIVIGLLGLDSMLT